MIPNKVQHKRDGQWFPWVAGSVDGSLLNMKAKQSDGHSVYINGCVVHGLQFDNGREWNIRDGWRRVVPSR